jgi:hypothetical protein
VRWRRVDLQRVIKERFGVDYCERYIGTLLKKACLLAHQCAPQTSRTARPDRRYVQKNFSLASSAHLESVPETTPIEIWFQDEAKIGQKNGIVHQWTKTGTRPRQPTDQRYEDAYLFGAICPARGVGAAIASPWVNTDIIGYSDRPT